MTNPMTAAKALLNTAPASTRQGATSTKTIAVTLQIKSEGSRRGKRHATAEATTEDPNHDVRIVAVGFVHGPHGTIAADLAIKVVPKPGS